MSWELPESAVTAWFRARFGRPTAVQSAAWPAVFGGRNALIVAPTGTGKTLAAFLAVLHDLDIARRAGTLTPSLHALYVSPLRALSYDLEKNLRLPLAEIYGAACPITVGLRSGDTDPAERRRQAVRPPHILLTTPESLLILLGQERWLPHLATVRRVIVDEVHALAENKRGAHLSLSLERLEALVAGNSREAAPSLPAPLPSNGTGEGEIHARRGGTLPEGPSPGSAVRGDAGSGGRFVGGGAGGGVHLQRLGLSATVAPVEDVARFLVGVGRPCEVVDVEAGKRLELDVYTPLTDDPYPVAGYTGVRLMAELGDLVRRHRTTLVFTNTRSGAEAVSYWLRSRLADLAEGIECHHASLDRDVRREVEDRLKRGELRAVVCSTSLELGIDIGSVDLVVMLSTPKGVTKALQRTGRAGHRIDTPSRGVLMATNLNDLVECCATAVLGRRRRLEAIRLPERPLDVLAQHLVGMACVGRWSRAAAFDLVRRAHVYRGLEAADFDAVLDYLAGGGRSLRDQYREVFGRVVIDDEGFALRAEPVRRDFLQNAGTIPTEGVVSVRLRMRNLGTVEEGFIRMLRPGDVFMLGGRPVRLVRTANLEAFVERADRATPTVPRWNANKMPLSNRVAEEIAAFRAELRARFEAGRPDDPGHAEWIAGRLECDPVNAAIILRTCVAQHEVSEIPTAEFVLVEEFSTDGREEAGVLESRDASGGTAEGAPPAGTGTSPRSAGRRRRRELSERAVGPARHYFFHALIGRTANDAVARVVARRLSRLRGGNAVVTPDDYGFVLTVAPEQRIGVEDLGGLLAPEGFAGELEESLGRSELLKYHFRNAAQTGLMVYRNQSGERRSVRRMQFSSEVIFNVLVEHEPDHVLLREARRDALHGFLDARGAVVFLERAAGLEKRLRRVDCVPPFSFALYASKIREALLVEDPRETMERLFRLWWGRAAGSAG